MNGSVRLVVLLVTVVVSPATRAADQIVEALRDAQAQSKAMTRSGQCRAKIEYRIYRMEGKGSLNPPVDPRDVLGEVDATLAWSDDSFSIQYWAEGWPRRSIGSYSLNRDDRDTTVVNNESYMHYDKCAKLLRIMPSQKTQMMSGILDINPRRAWYSCCPPDTTPGRPWSEMLDFQPPAAVGVTVRYETVDHRDGTITRVRTGSDGGVSTNDYSLALGGNPVSATYRDAQTETTLTYEWLTLRSGVFVPRHVHATKKFAGEMISDYSIIYRDHEVSGDDRAGNFTLEAVLRTLPRDVTIQDERPGARKTAKKKEAVNEAALRGLIEKNKSAGFAAP